MSLPFLLVLAMDGLVVTTTTPLALCPTVEAVELAVSERLRVVEGEQTRWEVVLENGTRTEPAAADLLRVKLVDEQGQVHADQLLDVSGADCNVRAQTVAVLVADFFESLRLEPMASAPPAASPSVAPEPSAAPAPAPPPPAPSRATAEPRFSVGLGVSLNDGQSPGGALKAVARISTLELSALVLAPGHQQETLSRGGRAEAWAAPLRLAAALGLRWRRVGLWLGPEFLASFERGITRGIGDDETNQRMVWGVGGQAGVRLFGAGPWAFFVLFAADYPLPVRGSRFQVDDTSVLDPGPLRYGAALGVDYDIF